MVNDPTVQSHDFESKFLAGHQGGAAGRLGCTLQDEDTRLHRQGDSAVRRGPDNRCPGRQGQVHLHLARRAGIGGQVYQAARQGVHI